MQRLQWVNPLTDIRAWLKPRQADADLRAQNVSL